MKKLLFFIVIIGATLSACKKGDDNAFNQSPDQRINEALAAYQDTLTSAPYGWKAFVTVDSGNGGTYSFYFKFNDSNRVTMLSDFDTTSAVTPKQSSYRLRAQQQPTLIFDTYNYIHVLADPNENTPFVYANINGGPLGKGLLSDFEFIIDNQNIKSDTITLIGKVHASKLKLVKATQQESTAFLSGQWILLSNYLTKKILTYYARLNLSGTLYDVRIDDYSRTVTISWVDGTNTTQTQTSGYYNTINGITLYNPVTNESQTIDKINILSWNQGTTTLSVSSNNNQTSGTITPTIFPIQLDKQAPDNWRSQIINNGGLWISIAGFHVNGVDDAFGLLQYSYNNWHYYWLQYEALTNGTFDAFYPLFVNANQDSANIYFVSEPKVPVLTNKGTYIFKQYGTAGAPYVAFPTTGPAGLTRKQFYSASGYYFVEINPGEYDMVSALDGKSWLRWDWAQ